MTSNMALVLKIECSVVEAEALASLLKSIDPEKQGLSKAESKQLDRWIEVLGQFDGQEK